MAIPDHLSQDSFDDTSPPSLQNPLSDDPVSASFEKLSLLPHQPLPENHDPPRRPLHVYLPPQILLLSNSPLVKPPDGMPSLKDWFGDPAELQVFAKKDSESSGSAAGTRDRRFRRDADDGDPPSRPTFRSALSQPSQMGNFRHQSIRTTDRDKDKDADKERERDIRDKEGAERLRNLSDKYDRDRLALSAASSLRNKDRDTAPHLNSSSSARLGQGQSANGTRRSEGRDPAKRKGENDDWRKGAESTRNARDDRSETSRRDRDTRDKPRSRSRPRRDPSTARRDRDRDRDDRNRERRGDDRDEHHSRRDRDDHYRRDWDDRIRDRDDSHRDSKDRRDYDGDDDPRRWRDDGKRDERMAARRERDRGWDRWEPGSERDRADDRDTRSKRAVGRDRRPGAGVEEGKDRDDRREREKEKEPAWMETYVPSSPGSGILGGQSAEGEIDGIQAWKKGMKEKEKKEKEPEESSELSSKKSPDLTVDSTPGAGAEPGLDEIQLFKLMMKREAEKKESEQTHHEHIDPSAAPADANTLDRLVEGSQSKSLSSSGDLTGVSDGERTAPNGLAQPETARLSTTDASRNLVSLISAPSSDLHPSNSASKQSPETTPDTLQPLVSRFFPNSPGVSPSTPQNDRTPADPPGSTPTSSFNPPQGSRLLAFASRGPGQATTNAPPKFSAPSESLLGSHPPPLSSGTNASKLLTPLPPNAMGTGLHQSAELSPNLASEFQFGGNARVTQPESPFAGRSYSPFGQQPQPAFLYDEIQEPRLVQAGDSIRRASAIPSPSQFGPPPEVGSPFLELGNPASNIPGNVAPYDLNANPAAASYAAGKGSRFAKFFDTKIRESQAGPGVRRASAGTGFVSPSPQSVPRQESMALNGMVPNNGEARTMEDIFAMLQNSAQSHRMSPQIGQPARGPGGGGSFGHAEIQAMQLQQLQQQQFPHGNRLDSLYDSRLDDRSFVPDGMVPGLRPATRPRSREPTGTLFNEHIDDPLQFNIQRVPQQVRNLDQMYPGQASTVFNQHANQQAIARNTTIQLQQAQFRGGPSPIQGPLQAPAHRLPPGLANLGGRPPHDPTQYINTTMGVPGGLHSGVLPNGSIQQGLGNFGGGNLGFGGNPPGRGPLPASHPPQNPLTLGQMANLGPNNSMDLRGPNQAQFLAMNANGMGLGGMNNNLRSVNGAFNPQHIPTSQLQGPHLAALRQQQQQQLPPHLMQQMLPPHLQPPQGIPAGNAQGAQDLMALLMGNHRD